MFSDIAQDFHAFIKDATLVIHNAKFDIGFINNEFYLVGMPKISMSGVIDTLLVARKKFPGSPASLDALCKRFKINTSEREKHSALVDCNLLTEVYIELLEKKEPLLDLQSSQADINDLDSSKTINTNRKRITVPITEEERNLHREFLKVHVPKSSMLD